MKPIAYKAGKQYEVEIEWLLYIPCVQCRDFNFMQDRLLMNIYLDYVLHHI
jgi:hypothetical protein